MRKCKYCELEAKKKPKGGYYRTCGNKECINNQYKNNNKYNLRKPHDNVCEHCKKTYQTTATYQRWCKECVPNERSLWLMKKYGITTIKYQEMLNDVSGICPICNKRPVEVVDHCHKTGKVRGLLCIICNSCLRLVEDKESLKRSIEYLGGK